MSTLVTQVQTFPGYHSHHNPPQAERFERALRRYLTRKVSKINIGQEDEHYLNNKDKELRDLSPTFSSFHEHDSISSQIGFEAVMRIRCTRGMSLHTFHGEFFLGFKT